MKFKVGQKEFEIADEEITKAITEKKTVLDLATDVQVRTTVEEAAFVENMKKDARKEGVEIAVKKYREESGLSFEGKNIDSLVKASTAKAIEDAKLNPDEKVKALEAKVTEKDNALKTALSKAEENEKKVKQITSQVKIDKALETFMPKNTLLPADDIKTILKSKMSFVEDEAGRITALDVTGNVIKNPSTADALDVKDVIENFFRENTHYVKAASGGGAGGDSGEGADGKMTIEKFIEKMKEENIAMNSPEYNVKLEAATKEGTLILD